MAKPARKSEPWNGLPEGQFANEVDDICTDILNMLVEKNKAYGNSVLDPVRVFSKASPVEQLYVRIDDKLSRLTRGENAGEDVIMDLIGYLVVLRIAQKRNLANK